MASRSLVYIFNEHRQDWNELPCPSDYKGYSVDVVDSGRNSNGDVVGKVIKEDVAKIELKWNFLTTKQYALLAQLFLEKYDGAFYVYVSFFDEVADDFEGDITIPPNNTTNICRLFYPNDRTATFAHITLDQDGKPIGYSGVSLNLVDTGFTSATRE